MSNRVISEPPQTRLAHVLRVGVDADASETSPPATLDYPDEFYDPMPTYEDELEEEFRSSGLSEEEYILSAIREHEIVREHEKYGYRIYWYVKGPCEGLYDPEEKAYRARCKIQKYDNEMKNWFRHFDKRERRLLKERISEFKHRLSRGNPTFIADLANYVYDRVLKRTGGKEPWNARRAYDERYFKEEGVVNRTLDFYEKSDGAADCGGSGDGYGGGSGHGCDGGGGVYGGVY